MLNFRPGVIPEEVGRRVRAGIFFGGPAGAFFLLYTQVDLRSTPVCPRDDRMGQGCFSGEWTNP